MHTGDGIDICQIQRGSCTGTAGLDVTTVRLNPTNACRLTARLDQHRVTTMKLPSYQRARHDRSSAGQREHAIDRQSRLTDIAWRQRCGEFLRERGLQRVESLSRDD
jgi:hypothetical protein